MIPRTVRTDKADCNRWSYSRMLLSQSRSRSTNSVEARESTLHQPMSGVSLGRQLFPPLSGRQAEIADRFSTILEKTLHVSTQQASSLRME
jgi:hypothetical protein